WGATRKIAISGNAQLTSVSCPSAGNCSAGGGNIPKPGQRGFVVNDRRRATGPRAGAAGGLQPRRPRPGKCGAGPSGGRRAAGSGQAFVVNETSGTWGAAEEVPGTAALNTGRNAEVDSVSCASAGRCSAGGDFTQKAGKQGRTQAFVVSET